MKAVECSRKAANLVGVLKRKLENLDDSLLGQLVAGYVASVIHDATTRDCSNEGESKEIEGTLDKAYRICWQYKNVRGGSSSDEA